MFKVTIRPHWEITCNIGNPVDTVALLKLLHNIQDSGSIAQAAKTVKLSYRYAWGLLREAERQFGASLLDTGRGRGTRLTPLGQKLVWADLRIAARLTPTLANLASELENVLENELGKVLPDRLRTIRLDASHGFAVAALTEHLNPQSIPLELRYRNSIDAVAALARGECDLAGFHVPIGKYQAQGVAWYARWLDPARHCLIHLAARQQGLFVAEGNPLSIKNLADLTRPSVRFVNRQTGSGTRMLLELMLARAGLSSQHIPGFASAEFTHSAVAAYIASGMADVGFGVRTATEHFGLDFVPLVEERYFFALNTAALDDPLIRTMVKVLQSADYHAVVNALSGYDASDTGKICSLDEAFGDGLIPSQAAGA